jgi:predicted DCC family thiol-disulfide oxidoreductase YuxK
VKHSWTGGAYSLWRAVFGVATASALAFDPLLAVPAWGFRLFVLLLGFALAAGIRDRMAAALLALVVVAAERRELLSGSPGALALVATLLLHAATHGSPYGTLDARGRADPGGSWILPRWNLGLRRLVAVGLAGAWIARGSPEIPWTLAATILIAACDPGWIPPLAAKSPARVFYDGNCGLCHRVVRLLLAEDPTGRAFRFAPLDSESARAAFSEEERRSLPDSVVVRTADGRTLLRSRGTLHLAERLGGVGRGLAALGHLIPTAALDGGYEFVALVRHRIFARPDAACPIVPRHLAARFDP